MKIGFIGAGNMGGAILRGMTAGGFSGKEICAYDRDTEKLSQLAKEIGIGTASSAEEVAGQADVVLFAVKPQMFATVLPPVAAVLQRRRPLVVSIAAGKSIASIEQLLGAGLPVVRVMPNIAAKVREGMAAFCGNALVGGEQKAVVRKMFESVGGVVELEERLFSAFSALASCSPAFTLLYIDALAEAGVRYGIPKATALEIAAQSVAGTTRLLQKSGEHPRALIDQVCSPAGTTIEGVCALQDGGFESNVLEAVRASYERDRSL